MVRCEEFYKRWSKDENWCEKCRTAVAEINNYMDLIESLECTYEIPHNVAIATLSEGAALPLIREKDPEIKEKAVLEVANRLNREQTRKRKGLKLNKYNRATSRR